MNIAEWQAIGRFVEIEKHRLFVVDTGRKKETIVILHGFPTSSYDFKDVLPLLSQRYRVIVHDHVGFGFSDKPSSYSYSLMEQADRALLLWSKLGVKKAHLVAHDYGTSMATEIIARRNMGFEPVRLQSLTLCNGSVHIELARLRIIQRLLQSSVVGPLVARLSSRRVFSHNMKELWHDPGRLSEEEIDSMWELLTRNAGRQALPRISQYLGERRLFWHRWVGALKESTLKSLILWGKSDPIAREDMARVHHAEMPGSCLRILGNLGHYPMMEGPEIWAEELLRFLK